MINKLSTVLGGLLFIGKLFGRKISLSAPERLTSSSFGGKFTWGTATAAYQIEGAYDADGKSPSIWDTFTNKPRRTKKIGNANDAVDFYHQFNEDLEINRKLNFNAFRFSLSWSRILPGETGTINQKGLDYYHRVIDSCLNKGMEPWITLYHWDLPQILEDKGGWTNREIVNWFSEYANVVTRHFGDKVKNWCVLNEPMSFVGLGYFVGYHAPGRRGVRNFLPAAHHATLCQAEGGRIIRQNVKAATVGTTFSTSYVEPVNDKESNQKAAERMDAVLNRFFLEPALGMGYPLDTIPALQQIEKHFNDGDEEKMIFDFDFIGVQYYFRTIARFSLFPPILFARDVPAQRRDVPVNTMNLEIYPDGLYHILKKFAAYPQINKLIVTESGVCFHDTLIEGHVHDPGRISYFQETMKNLKKAKDEGVPVDGFFAWTLMDNFEWSEGFEPRFGLVYVDHATKERFIKDSGYWFRDFLTD